MSTLQQNWRKRQNRFCLEERGVRERGREPGEEGEMAQAMHAHMNK
jgi:hypothetical protein